MDPNVFKRLFEKARETDESICSVKNLILESKAVRRAIALEDSQIQIDQRNQDFNHCDQNIETPQSKRLKTLRSQTEHATARNISNNRPHSTVDTPTFVTFQSAISSTPINATTRIETISCIPEPNIQPTNKNTSKRPRESFGVNDLVFNDNLVDHFSPTNQPDQVNIPEIIEVQNNEEHSGKPIAGPSGIQQQKNKKKEEEGKALTCDICYSTYVFASDKELQKHKKKCTNRAICDVCGKDFINLEKHQKNCKKRKDSEN